MTTADNVQLVLQLSSSPAQHTFFNLDFLHHLPEHGKRSQWSCLPIPKDFNIPATPFIYTLPEVSFPPHTPAPSFFLTQPALSLFLSPLLVLVFCASQHGFLSKSETWRNSSKLGEELSSHSFEAMLQLCSWLLSVICASLFQIWL